MIENKIIVIEKNDLEILIQDVVKNALDKSNSEQQIQNPFLDISEAADFLKMAKQTLYGLTSNRQIPFIKKGKKVYFNKSEIVAWLNEGKMKTRVEILKAGFK
jgi:excisionase family DNA binding protein